MMRPQLKPSQTYSKILTMLKEFAGKQYHTQVENFNEYAQSMVHAFDSCVDFLRNPQAFPNEDINEVASLMWKLIGNKEVPVVLDKWGLPSLSFAVVGEGIVQTPYLIIPTDFTKQMQLNPVSQLGIVGYMASQCRDVYAGKIKNGNSEEINLRAQAYEAETLLTLQTMAQNEGVEIAWIQAQQEYIQKFPNGLKDLPVHLHYPTPEYRPNPGHRFN
jgi:hypothetical protein